MLYFENDYCEGAHPAILQKLTETNFEKVSGYGTDPYCAKMCIRDSIRAALFETLILHHKKNKPEDYCNIPPASTVDIPTGWEPRDVYKRQRLRRPS